MGATHVREHVLRAVPVRVCVCFAFMYVRSQYRSCARACAVFPCGTSMARVHERVQMSLCARACASVRCAPTRDLYNERVHMSSCAGACTDELGTGACADELVCEGVCFFDVRAHKGFVQCASVHERVQMSSCARACASVRCGPTRALCNVLVCGSVCR